MLVAPAEKEAVCSGGPYFSSDCFSWDKNSDFSIALFSCGCFICS
jgi:hypothetical protein